jgi:hypothetical protein
VGEGIDLHIFLNQILSVKVLVEINWRVVDVHSVVSANSVHLIVLLLGNIEMMRGVVESFATDWGVLDGGV